MEKQRIQQLPMPDRKGHDAIINASYIDDIATELKTWGSKRVLLVVSKSLDSVTDKIRLLEQELGKVVADKKAGVGAHSPYSDVIDIARRVHAHNIDAVVCVGSSSYTDACRIALLLHATLPPGFTIDDMEALIDQERGVIRPDSLKPRQVKLILVPTSLSASEWNHYGSCTNPDGKKQHFYHITGASDLLLLDPRLAATAPEDLWLSSGVRAIDHCVETMCNVKGTEDSNKHAEMGLRKLLKGLKEYKDEKGKENGEKLVVGILDCQLGARESIMGAIIWKVRVGPSHAIGHQLGAVTGILHGMTSAILLAPVLRYTKNQNPTMQRRVVQIFNEVLGWQEVEAGDAVERFVKLLGMPTRLSQVGVADDKVIRQVAHKSMTDVLKIELSESEVYSILNSVRDFN